MSSEAGVARRGHPLRWASAARPPQVLLCRYRADECMRHAALRDWPAFSCAGCQDAAPTPLGDVAQEHQALLVLAAVVLDPAERPIGELRRPPRSIAGKLAELAGRRS